MSPKRGVYVFNVLILAQKPKVLIVDDLYVSIGITVLVYSSTPSNEKQLAEIGGERNDVS